MTAGERTVCISINFEHGHCVAWRTPHSVRSCRSPKQATGQMYRGPARCSREAAKLSWSFRDTDRTNTNAESRTRYQQASDRSCLSEHTCTIASPCHFERPICALLPRTCDPSADEN